MTENVYDDGLVDSVWQTLYLYDPMMINKLLMPFYIVVHLASSSLCCLKIHIVFTGHLSCL